MWVLAVQFLPLAGGVSGWWVWTGVGWFWPLFFFIFFVCVGGWGGGRGGGGGRGCSSYISKRGQQLHTRVTLRAEG